VTLGGALAMGLTALIGQLIGTTGLCADAGVHLSASRLPAAATCGGRLPGPNRTGRTPLAAKAWRS
jgi:hypothetical protein